MSDLFPAGDFDAWAENYDQSVVNTQGFPFTGYENVLDKVVQLATPQAGMSILDLGIGTGNLALRFDASGREIWGSDFSAAMLAKAQVKLPKARLFQADLRALLQRDSNQSWPASLKRRFDRIVSAYVFHHFELGDKVEMVNIFVHKHLEPSGKLIIADLAFQNQNALEDVKQAAGNEWEDEYYWLADETLPALKKIGLKATYTQVSPCAGIYSIE
jgi:putative AdoMet-dependent methyltransferase